MNKMIVIVNIKLHTVAKHFSPKTKKLLKFQLQKKIIHVKSSSIWVSQRQLMWEQQIILNKQGNETNMSFQIYEKHTFGYNPSQFLNILYGKAKIVNHSSIKDLSVFSFSSAQIIGTLSILLKNTFPLNREIKSDKKLFIINSIVAHVPSLRSGSVYFVIRVGKNSIQTYHSKTQSGELVFVQRYELQKEADNFEARVELRATNQQNQENSMLIASGKLVLSNTKSTKKIILLNTLNTTIGEAFINMEIIDKNERQKLRKILKSESPNTSVFSSNKSIFMSKSKRFKELMAINEETFVYMVREKSALPKHKKMKAYNYKIGSFQPQRIIKPPSDDETTRDDVHLPELQRTCK